MIPNEHDRQENGNLHCIGICQVTIISFGYGHDTPPEADITLDLRRHFRNPHHDPAMIHLTGLDGQVAQHVSATAGIRRLVGNTVQMVLDLLHDVADPAEKKVFLAVGCAGGRHRSVAAAESIAALLMSIDVGVEVEHRDMYRPLLPAS